MLLHGRAVLPIARYSKSFRRDRSRLREHVTLISCLFPLLCYCCRDSSRMLHRTYDVEESIPRSAIDSLAYSHTRALYREFSDGMTEKRTRRGVERLRKPLHGQSVRRKPIDQRKWVSVRPKKPADAPRPSRDRSLVQVH